MELEGRINLGGGALQLKVYEYENILVFKNDIIESLLKDKNVLNELIEIYNNLEKTNFKSIFTEFGTQNYNKFNLENISGLRKKIDEIVFDKLLNLTYEEKIELYKSIMELIYFRIIKAKRKN